jgi:hypothetical protein
MFSGESELHLRMSGRRIGKNKEVVSVLVGGKDGMEARLTPGGAVEKRLLQEATDRLNRAIRSSSELDLGVVWTHLYWNRKLDV